MITRDDVIITFPKMISKFFNILYIKSQLFYSNV